MTTLSVHVEGIGLWSPGLPDFAALPAWLAGQTSATPARPPAAMLPPNERRRATESVLLAIEVASQAVAMSGRDAAELACVFASAYNDQALTDALCDTLARAPGELSPTGFHNSVHNAPVGYWTIATGCHAPSTAVCAHETSFGAGLLEAAVLACAEQRPVLLSCSDAGGRGTLVAITGCQVSFGCALVLAPTQGEATLATLDLSVTGTAIEPAHAAGAADALRIANHSAAALPLLALIAAGQGHCRVRAAAALDLAIAVEQVSAASHRKESHA